MTCGQCMPRLPSIRMPESERVKRAAAEISKASPELVMREEWPDNYIKAVINQYHRNRYVIIPPVASVLRALKDAEIPMILFYPEYGAKEEYEKRYLERGNTENFIDIFIGGWDRFHRTLESIDCKHRFVMKKDKYLLDYLVQIDQIIKEEESVVTFDLAEGTMEDVRKLYEATGFDISEHIRRFLINTSRTDGEYLRELWDAYKVSFGADGEMNVEEGKTDKGKG